MSNENKSQSKPPAGLKTAEQERPQARDLPEVTKEAREAEYTARDQITQARKILFDGLVAARPELKVHVDVVKNALSALGVPDSDHPPVGEGHVVGTITDSNAV